MNARIVTIAATALAILSASNAGAVLYTAAQKTCIDGLMHANEKYVMKVGHEIHKSIKANLNPTNKVCAAGRKCVGGALHAAPCLINTDCPGGGNCYPNFFTGAGVATHILGFQNTLRTSVAASCSGVLATGLGFPSALCPTDPGGATIDKVVDCLLRNNASSRGTGNIVDTTYEPFRRAATHLEVPHPASFATYPTTVCGVPGSFLLQYGSNSTSDVLGREGGTRLLSTTGCAGDVCSTRGESATAFAGNMLDDPINAYAGLIPLCFVLRPSDVGNGTFETGSIDLVQGIQSSFQRIQVELYIGAACPRCLVSTGKCDSGPRLGLSCLHKGAEDIACPPAGTPTVSSCRSI
jgi:hypothetical protein